MSGESWQTTSGLIDNYDFHIEQAWFGKNEKFGDSLLLNLRGPAYQEGELVEEEVTNLYSCGDGWEAADGGEKAEHKAGKTTFNKQSSMGKLIDAVVGLGDEVLEELSTRGETYEAETWAGLILHIEREEFTYTDRKTQESRSYEVPLPTDFLGVIDEEEAEPAPKAKAKASTKSSAPARKPRTTKAKAEPAAKAKPATRTRTRGKKAAEPEPADNSDLREAIMEFAAGYEDHNAFVAAVFDTDEFDRAEELQEDEELSNEVLDEESEIWTESGE